MESMKDVSATCCAASDAASSGSPRTAARHVERMLEYGGKPSGSTTGGCQHRGETVLGVMYRLLKLAVGAWLLAACERPTAPEARDIARSVEQKLARGDLRGVQEMFWTFGRAGRFWGGPKSNIAPLAITRDGRTEEVNGVVVEEVFVPHDGVGKPLVRRTLAGWPDDLEFAVYVASEAGPFRSPAPPHGRRSNVPANNVMVHRRDTLRTWIAQGAVVRIDEPVIERRCDGLRDSLSTVLTDTVTCHIGLYQVAVRSELLARPDHESRLRRGLARVHQLVIAPQQMPGVRFTTQCSAEPGMREPLECLDPFLFWRDNDQYAPSLGIDVARFEPTSNGTGAWYVERSQNSDPGPAWITGWTVHTPDGRLVEQGTVDSAGVATPPRNFEEWGHLGHRGVGLMPRYIAPARALDPDASPNDVRIVTVSRRREPIIHPVRQP